MIRRGEQSLVLNAEVAEQNEDSAGIKIGIQRDMQERGLIRIRERSVRSASELADCLPVQLIDARVFTLLTGGPQERRSFMDWGTFHVKPEFRHHWHRSRRSVRQRNAALRAANSGQDREVALWSAELATHGEEVDSLRQAWVREFLEVLKEVQQQLLFDWDEQPELSYYRGWNKQSGLRECLLRNPEEERRRGHTLYGPHLADIRLTLGGQAVTDVLSRGQQKLLAAALRLAQGLFVFRVTGKRCVFLVDDLPAELDMEYRDRLFSLLKSLGGQVFVSCIELQSLQGLWDAQDSVALFHVKQGDVFRELAS